MRYVISLVLLLVMSSWASAADSSQLTNQQRWAALMPYLMAAQDTPRRFFVVSADPRESFRPAEPSPTNEAFFMWEMETADVILIGEQHDDPATHRVEQDLVQKFFPMYGYLPTRYRCVAMEMFERDVQSKLTSYLLDRNFDPNRTSESEFLANTRPWPNYMADYRPIIELFRYFGSPDVSASNAPTPIARRVAKEGLDPVLKSLTPEERGWVAETTTSPKDEYWQRFLAAMGGGGSASDQAHGMGMTEDQIYGFYQAQCLKDDTMAETIARLREQDPQRQVVHLSGSFHIDYHLGIYPRLVQRRPEDKIVTVALRPVENFEEATLKAALEAEPGVADYVVFVLKEQKAAETAPTQ